MPERDHPARAGGATADLHIPLWILALVTFSGTLAMHIFIPALPVAADDFGVGIGAMQMTISLYILGLALGQLVYGPVSDRFGRRSTLMVGLTLYTVASLAAALAPNVHALIVVRLFQALGGCAGLVLGRAIVRDTSPPTETARRLALMNLMVTLGPAVAPLIGGVLASMLGWRSIFIALCALGIANLMLSWRLLPETGASRTGGSGVALARNYWQLLRSPAFLGYAIGGGCATTSMYAFIAAAPFILVDHLHRTTAEVGPYLALLVLGVWAGSVLASRLIVRVSIRRLLIGANALSVVAAFALVAIVLAGQLTVTLLVVTMFLFTLGVGTAAPAALTQAISVNPNVIGSASGLYGFSQMAVGALCTALVGLGGDPALAAPLVLAAAGVVAQLSFWIALRRPAGG
jgi:DHA1 family bicyclomycin/chloramphenicol resistance-like MFS transporter